MYKHTHRVFIINDNNPGIDTCLPYDASLYHLMNLCCHVCIIFCGNNVVE